MKYLQPRNLFLNKDYNKINEILENDIAWGDSLLGRMINSLIRKGKIEVNAKRIDSLLVDLRGEFDKILAKASFKEPNSIAIVVKGILNGLYKAVENDEPIDQISNLVDSISSDIEKNKYDLSDDYKKDIIEKLNKFKEIVSTYKKEDTAEENKEEGKSKEDSEVSKGDISYPDVYNKSLTKYANKINISISNKDLIDKILRGDWSFVNNIQGSNFKLFATALVKMLTDNSLMEFMKKTNQTKLLQALSKVGGSPTEKSETTAEKTEAPKKKYSELTKQTKHTTAGEKQNTEVGHKTNDSLEIDFDSLFEAIETMEHICICINEEADLNDDIFKSLIQNHKKDITNVLNLYIKRDIEASKKDPNFVKKNKEKFGDNWESKVKNSAKGLLKKNLYGLGSVSKGSEDKEIAKKNQIWGIGKAATAPFNVIKGDTIIKVAFALDKVQRENPKAGINDYPNLLRKTIDEINNPIEVDSSIKQRADMIYGINKSLFEKETEEKKESVFNYLDFIKINEAEESQKTAEDTAEDVKHDTAESKDNANDKLIDKFKSLFAPKDYSIDTEERKKAEAEVKKGIESDQTLTHDSILKIVDLFGKAYRLTTTNTIPSGRKGGKVSNVTFNEYEHLGGSGGTQENPGFGPWRNIKVFDKWASGVRDILGNMRYRKLFSEGTTVNGVKNGGKHLADFINKMVNDKEFCSKGSAQSDFINKYFGIKKEEDPGRSYYDKPGIYTDGKKPRAEKIDKDKEAKEIKFKKVAGISAKTLRESKHMLFAVKVKNPDNKELYWSFYTIGDYNSDKEKKFFVRANRSSLDIINRYIGKEYKLGKYDDIKSSAADPDYYVARVKNYVDGILPGKKMELSYVKINEQNDKDLKDKVVTSTYEVLSVHVVYDTTDNIFVVKDTDELKEVRSKKDGLFIKEKYIEIL
jgi:hypothetical protein